MRVWEIRSEIIPARGIVCGLAFIACPKILAAPNLPQVLLASWQLGCAPSKKGTDWVVGLFQQDPLRTRDGPSDENRC
jgi:hypothetical protein